MSLRRVVGATLIASALACNQANEPAPPNLELQVAILGRAVDPRVATVREAMAHWNAEFQRLGVRVRLDSGTVRERTVSDDVLRAVSDELLSGGAGTNVAALRTSMQSVPADIVIALSDTDLISIGLTWGADRQGIVVLRRSDILPLSLPNALRNVVAHELGHVFGLIHNSDPTTLMCGRPASCRPADFESSTPRFFPLTAADEAFLRQRSWP